MEGFRNISGIIALVGGFILFLANVICLIVAIRKSKEAEYPNLVLLTSIVTFVGNLLINYAFGTRCVCGSPMINLGAFIAAPLFIIINWVRLFIRMKESDDGVMVRTFILFFVETLFLVGLHLSTPELHKDAVKAALKATRII